MLQTVTRTVLCTTGTTTTTSSSSSSSNNNNNNNVDKWLLQMMALLAGLPPLQFVEQQQQQQQQPQPQQQSNSKFFSLELQCSVQNVFTGQTVTTTATGLVGCLRLLLLSSSSQNDNNSNSGSSLLMGETAAQQAVTESWWQSAEQTVMPIIRQQQKQQQAKTESSLSSSSSSTSSSSESTIVQAALEDYAQHIARHLWNAKGQQQKKQQQQWLVTSYPTAADVVVAVSLAAAIGIVAQQQQQPTTIEAATAAATAAAAWLPQACADWCVTTLQHLETCCKAVAASTSTSTSTATATATAITTTIKSLLPDLTMWLQAVQGAATGTRSTTTTTTTEPAAAVAAAEAEASTTVSTSTSTPVEWDAQDPDNAVLKALQKHGIPCTPYNHVACDTAEALVANVPLPDPSHTHTKNLFLRDKKHGLFLVSVRAKAVVNTKQLGQDLKLAGKTNLRLADAAVLWDYLRVKPGCVGPLCVLQDDVRVKTVGMMSDEEAAKTAVTVVLDQALVSGKQYRMIHSHPLRNDMSVPLTPEQLKLAFNKAGVDPILLEFESATEAGGKAPANRPPGSKEKAGQHAKQQQQQQQQQTKKKEPSADKKTPKKGETLLKLQWRKDEHFPNWYTDVIVLSEMISYYDISGCYILRPWSYRIWEIIQEWFNEQIQELGVENSYFPLFVSQDRLEKEKDHVEGFAPEVAWVTKSGEGELARPIAIRPTSETIMYPAFSDWIRSHRDLPLKLNQWSNVVRWEFKYPTPFLRTREFLWQEGHTAHETFEEAEEMVMAALNLYKSVYEDLLAVPVVPGVKTEKEKFAGGFKTTTVEAYIAGSGRAIQGATSHNLGQNFGKMFDITFQGKDSVEKQVAWQTSWGLTTRTIGVMVMVHGDDTGLVLPPRVAPVQVVIVPIISKALSYEEAAPYCQVLIDDLKATGVRVRYDDRDAYNPGWKYNHWEQKGVPIRLEVGPKDMEKKMARVVIRHNGHKEDYPVEGMGQAMAKLLQEIQVAMFEKAKAARNNHIVQVTEWKDFVPNLEKNNLVLTPWCGGEHQDWEEWVKNTSREESLKLTGEEGEDEKTATSVAAKTLCIPFDQPELPAGTKCIASGMEATCWVLWGRSY